jgi:BirA family biotin operon repressor/biotin-[acetyl-CoA-carboxylase] ligase
VVTGAIEPLPPDLSAAVAEVNDACGAGSLVLHYRSEVGSTNDVLAELAAAGAAEGTAVIADRQTSGRGRHGRTWHSPPGAGLYLSMLFRPGAGAPAPGEGGATLITLMAGVVVSEAIEAAAGLRAALKWPNDLVVETSGPRRLKLAGVLAEGTAVGGALQYVVLGVGINLRQSLYPLELRGRVTSIEQETGRPVDRGALVSHLLVGLVQGGRELSSGGGRSILQRWRQRASASIGREVEWQGPGGLLRGVTRDIDESGALLVDAAGGVQRIVAGEVTWL